MYRANFSDAFSLALAYHAQLLADRCRREVGHEIDAQLRGDWRVEPMTCGIALARIVV